jgi:hypothetical protein
MLNFSVEEMQTMSVTSSSSSSGLISQNYETEYRARQSIICECNGEYPPPLPFRQVLQSAHMEKLGR